MDSPTMAQPKLFTEPVRYVFRERYYPEPPADWPPPREACQYCQLLQEFAEELHAGWRWNGYFYECKLHDDEGNLRGG